MVFLFPKEKKEEGRGRGREGKKSSLPLQNPFPCSFPEGRGILEFFSCDCEKKKVEFSRRLASLKGSSALSRFFLSLLSSLSSLTTLEERKEHQKNSFSIFLSFFSFFFLLQFAMGNCFSRDEGSVKKNRPASVSCEQRGMEMSRLMRKEKMVTV